MAAISRRRGQPKLPGSLKKIHLRESVFKQWREKKQHLGFEEHTDSVFAEFLLHRRKATTNRGSADRNLSLSVEDNGTEIYFLVLVVILQCQFEHLNTVNTVPLHRNVDLTGVTLEQIEPDLSIMVPMIV
ncbi:hypothetical protein OS493_009049 [Desmophyllum pertusum]|uniref:Uncharacterized protein n=1 Tax=Desmophyllum pertusum TaxID=174260 RepID=A0A9W9ZF88_9CNID|nr:hypothetical protein OS493_009049 [Desmophyllum pertusum]